MKVDVYKRCRASPCMCPNLHGVNPAQICKTDYVPALLKWVDAESLPEYLGGTSKATLLDDAGPWQDPKVLAQVLLVTKT